MRGPGVNGRITKKTQNNFRKCLALLWKQRILLCDSEKNSIISQLEKRIECTTKMSYHNFEVCYHQKKDKVTKIKINSQLNLYFLTHNGVINGVLQKCKIFPTTKSAPYLGQINNHLYNAKYVALKNFCGQLNSLSIIYKTIICRLEQIITSLIQL